VEAHNGSMATPTAVDDADMKPSECWCCGATGDSARMVHLGNHPEVALCTRCARWAAKQAWEIDDRLDTGPLVLLRERLRATRRRIVSRGWQHNRLLGGPLRWIGKRLP
jgi:hypothetical protein